MLQLLLPSEHQHLESMKTTVGYIKNNFQTKFCYTTFTNICSALVKTELRRLVVLRSPLSSFSQQRQYGMHYVCLFGMGLAFSLGHSLNPAFVSLLMVCLSSLEIVEIYCTPLRRVRNASTN